MASVFVSLDKTLKLNLLHWPERRPNWDLSVVGNVKCWWGMHLAGCKSSQVKQNDCGNFLTRVIINNRQQCFDLMGRGYIDPIISTIIIIKPSIIMFIKTIVESLATFSNLFIIPFSNLFVLMSVVTTMLPKPDIGWVFVEIKLHWVSWRNWQYY